MKAHREPLREVLAVALLEEARLDGAPRVLLLDLVLQPGGVVLQPVLQNPARGERVRDFRNQLACAASIWLVH